MEGKRFAWEKSFLSETTTGSKKLFGYERLARNTIEIGSIDILSGGRVNKLEELFPLTGFCKSLDMSEEICSTCFVVRGKAITSKTKQFRCMLV